jgi:hypothetical protein
VKVSRGIGLAACIMGSRSRATTAGSVPEKGFAVEHDLEILAVGRGEEFAVIILHRIVGAADHGRVAAAGMAATASRAAAILDLRRIGG